jgi:hypothetical protein
MVSRGRLSEMAARAAAAVVGGYALAWTSAIGFAAVLVAADIAAADAVVSAGMLSFLVYAAAIIWAFGSRSARRAWSGIGVGIAGFVAVVPLAALLR